MSDRKKLNQLLVPTFKPDQEGWENKESETISEIKSSYEKELILQESDEMKEDNEPLPHQKSIEDIIYDMRIVFFKVLEISLNKQNPLPYILSESKNQFSFCLIVITIGILMLLISNLLK